MSLYTAFLDSNTLYSMTLRDLIMQLAVDDLFRAKWSADVQREWVDNLLANNPGIDPVRVVRTRDLMDKHTRDALVTGYEPLIPALALPDPDDRHVLGAAIVGHCDVIVTKNLRHFPEDILSRYGINAMHPDDFLSSQLNLAPELFCAAVRTVRTRLKNPAAPPAEYLARLRRQALAVTAAELEQFVGVI